MSWQTVLALWWLTGLQYYMKFSDKGPIHQIDKGEPVSLRRTAALIACLPWIVVLHLAVFGAELGRGLWAAVSAMLKSISCTFYGKETPDA